MKTDKILDVIREVHEQFKGGAGSGNFGHSGRPGKLGGSAGGGSMGGSGIPLGGKDKPYSKGYSIQFDGVPGYHKLAGFTDAHIEKKLSALEKATGKKLSRDDRTDFPTFTVYEDGEEIGGG